ncbi:MAG: hypothetical protein II888_07110 [Clostridia bacterium]|nr:hypothetical protein [Clostridia bacterium]
MGKLDPTVRKETGYIAAWVLALSLLMQGVFLLLGKWEFPVLTGNLIGGITAIGNFLLLALTVVKAAGGPKEKVALRVRSSMTARLLGQAAIAAIAVGVLHTNVLSTLLPLLFPRIGIALRPLIDRKRGKGTKQEHTAEAEGSDLIE